MGIVERIAQLLLANVNDLLDQAEDPEKMLNQYLREMESQRRQAREAIIDMISQEKLLEADWLQHVTRSAKWNTTATTAAKTGRDDLAIEALCRKRSDQELASLYETQLTSQRRAVSQMKAQMSALDARYQRTLSQRDLLIARHRRARAQESVARRVSALVLPDFEAEFERMHRKIQSKEARAIALAEISLDSIDEQLLSLDTDIEIAQELALLKAELESPGVLSGNVIRG